MLATALHLAVVLSACESADTVFISHRDCVFAAVVAYFRKENRDAESVPLALLPLLVKSDAYYGIRLKRNDTGYDWPKPLDGDANSGEAFTLVSDRGVQYELSYTVEYDNGRIDNTASPLSFKCNVLVTIALKGGDVKLRSTYLMTDEVTHIGHADKRYRLSPWTGRFRENTTAGVKALPPR